MKIHVFVYMWENNIQMLYKAVSFVDTQTMRCRGFRGSLLPNSRIHETPESISALMVKLSGLNLRHHRANFNQSRPNSSFRKSAVNKQNKSTHLYYREETTIKLRFNLKFVLTTVL